MEVVATDEEIRKALLKRLLADGPSFPKNLLRKTFGPKPRTRRRGMQVLQLLEREGVIGQTLSGAYALHALKKE